MRSTLRLFESSYSKYNKLTLLIVIKMTFVIISAEFSANIVIRASHRFLFLLQVNNFVVRMNHLTILQRAEIVILYQQNITISEIARRLMISVSKM